MPRVRKNPLTLEQRLFRRRPEFLRALESLRRAEAALVERLRPHGR